MVWSGLLTSTSAGVDLRCSWTRSRHWGVGMPTFSTRGWTLYHAREPWRAGQHRWCGTGGRRGPVEVAPPYQSPDTPWLTPVGPVVTPSRPPSLRSKGYRSLAAAGRREETSSVEGKDRSRRAAAHRVPAARHTTLFELTGSTSRGPCRPGTRRVDPNPVADPREWLSRSR